jgi:hypothetical protein
MFLVSVQASNKSAVNSPVKPSAPEGPARMVLAVPDEPARGRKPVLRDEVAAVVAKQQYPRERLLFFLCFFRRVRCVFWVALVLSFFCLSYAGTGHAQRFKATDDERPPTTVEDEKPPVDIEKPPDSVLPPPKEEESKQSRLIATVLVGGALRLSKNSEFGQGDFTPAFVEAYGGYVLPFGGVYKQGFGIGVSTNITTDGGFREPVYEFRQLVINPGYLAYLDFNRNVTCLGHFSIPFQILGSSRSWGIEMATGIGYKLTAGWGVYIHSALDFYFGANSTVHTSASLEGGFVFDYEILP